MTSSTDDARCKRTNAVKVRRAAADPRRPGAECKAPPVAFVPVVNHGKCEAKGDCVEVCPYDVFEVGPIDEKDYRALGWLGRVRVRVHGMRTAYTQHADRCLACRRQPGKGDPACRDRPSSGRGVALDSKRAHSSMKETARAGPRFSLTSSHRRLRRYGVTSPILSFDNSLAMARS